jgi:serine/threonine protein kinase
MLCPNCKREADQDDRFCPHCGYVQPGAQFTVPRVSSSITPTTGPGARDRLIERVRKATVGRFDILRSLGRGGMAAVYLAYDLRLDRKVAVKVMLPQLELAEGMTERFAQEARTAARLDHPNIIVVHDVVELDDLVLLVMNLINGAPLEQVLLWLPAAPNVAARRLPIAAVQSILVQVASALEYAHGERVVHRDIKPSNVMITVKGDAVITDFGIAKVVADSPHSKSSALMGTPTYMSPEQCKGQAVSGASDQYSLGVMAYELLVGEPPFMGSSLDVQNAHVEREPQPLLDRHPGVPAALAAAVMRMLAKRPAERFASMTEVARALGAGFSMLDPAPRRLLGSAAVSAVTARDTTAEGGPQTPRGALPPRTPSGAVSFIAVSAPDHVEVGDTFTVVATPEDSSGNSVPGVNVTVTSHHPDIAVVDAARGTVTAIRSGRAKLVAAGGGARGEVFVVVMAKRVPVNSPSVRSDRGSPAVATIRINPLPLKVYVGDAMMLVATALDVSGSELEGRMVSWTSSASDVASVAPNGMLKARGPGKVQFICECEGKLAMAQLTIVAGLAATNYPIPGVEHMTVRGGAPPQAAARRPPLDITPRGNPPPAPEPQPKSRIHARAPRRSRNVLVAIVGAALVVAVVVFVAPRVFSPAKPEVPIESPFSENALKAITTAGYWFGGAQVASNFSDAPGGRLVRAGDLQVFRQDDWNVDASDYVAHFEMQYEDGDRSQDAGLLLSAGDLNGDPSVSYYLLLLRDSTPPTYALDHVENGVRRTLVWPTRASGLTDGNNKIEVIVIGSRISLYVNGKFVATAPTLPRDPNGQFGLYVAPGAQYSFDNLAVAALRRN